MLLSLQIFCQGYWNKWSAKLESDRFFLSLLGSCAWTGNSAKQDENARKYANFLLLSFQPGDIPRNDLQHFWFNRFDICWTSNDDTSVQLTKTNTVHSLLDYGDYDKMKEFFYILYAYLTTWTRSMKMTTTPTDRSCNTIRPEKKGNESLQYFAVIKYPDDIYANDLNTSCHLQNVVTFSKDIDKVCSSLSLSIPFAFSLSPSGLFALHTANEYEFRVCDEKAFAEKKKCLCTKIDIKSHLKTAIFTQQTNGLLHTWTFSSTDWVFLIMLANITFKVLSNAKRARERENPTLLWNSFRFFSPSFLFSFVYIYIEESLSLSSSFFLCISSWRVCNWDSEDYIESTEMRDFHYLMRVRASSDPFSLSVSCAWSSEQRGLMKLMRTAVSMLKLGYISCVYVCWLLRFFHFFFSSVFFSSTFQHVQSFQQHQIFTNKTDDDDLVCCSKWLCIAAEESVQVGWVGDESLLRSINRRRLSMPKICAYAYEKKVLCEKCKWLWNQPQILLKKLFFF